MQPGNQLQLSPQLSDEDGFSASPLLDFQDSPEAEIEILAKSMSPQRSIFKKKFFGTEALETIRKSGSKAVQKLLQEINISEGNWIVEAEHTNSGLISKSKGTMMLDQNLEGFFVLYASPPETDEDKSDCSEGLKSLNTNIIRAPETEKITPTTSRKKSKENHTPERKIKSSMLGGLMNIPTQTPLREVQENLAKIGNAARKSEKQEKFWMKSSNLWKLELEVRGLSQANEESVFLDVAKEKSGGLSFLLTVGDGELQGVLSFCGAKEAIVKLKKISSTTNLPSFLV